MLLSKFKRISLASLLLMSGSQVSLRADDGCHPKVATSNVTVIHAGEVGVEELISQLEKLVDPVSDKVAYCNADLLRAKEAADVLGEELSCVVTDQAKTRRALNLLQNSLRKSSCTVVIDDRCYDRETVGKVIETKLAKYRSQVLSINRLTAELKVAQKHLEDTLATVQRWVAKERELLAQIESLEASSQQTVSDAKAVKGQVEDLSHSIDEMFQKSLAGNGARDELVAEVDRLLNQN